jgi:hypothetical protein
MTILHIEWLDSETDHGWHRIEDLEHELGLTHSTGFLIHESDVFLLIAHSYDPDTESANGLMTIPKGAIKARRTICRVKV